MIDKKTSYLSLPLPDADNALAEDCPRLAEALTKTDAWTQKTDTRVTSAEQDIDALQSVQAAHTSELSDIKTSMAALGADSVHKTGDETISGVKTFTQTIEGTAAAAEKLATARTITLSGAASGSISFDGSADATLEVSIGGDQGAVIGEIRWFAMSTPPEGWLVCNGSAVAISDYPALYNAIGNTFLPEDVPASPATFDLPNLIGKVPWGSTSVGTVIDAGLPDLTGKLEPIATNKATNIFTKTGVFINTTHVDWSGGSGNTTQRVTVQFEASRSNPIYGSSDTVQPPALCLLPCIRYE